MSNPTPVCATCKHCRKPTDFTSLPVTWRCAAAEPYSSTPGHTNPLTGDDVPERVVLIPCSWQNEAGLCDLYESGDPGSTGEVAYPNPNSLLWRRRKREQEATRSQGSAAPIPPVVAAMLVSIFVFLLMGLAVLLGGP